MGYFLRECLTSWEESLDQIMLQVINYNSHYSWEMSYFKYSGLNMCT